MLYNRRISVARASAQAGEGAQPYGGRTQAGQTSIATGIAASVQAKREGQRGAVGLPGDGTRASWRIFTPRGALQDGQVRDGDLITDDLGRRFQVTSDYCHNLGCTFFAERLEA